MNIQIELTIIVRAKTFVASLIVFCALFLFAPTTQAANLEVDFGNPPVPSGSPVFTVSNMLPGDTEAKNITVKNNTTSSMNISIVSEKISETKNFDDILDVHLYKNTTNYYGGPTPKKLDDFFSDSAAPDGFFLFTLPPNSQTDFFFSIHFPNESGNEYQEAQIIFDLQLGTTLHSGNHILINEVYYDVDESHGLDCPKDRGILGITGNNLIIRGNGEGSTNTINVTAQNLCTVIQQNNGNLNNAVNVYLNTGGNTGERAITGNANFLTRIRNFLGMVNP